MLSFTPTPKGVGFRLLRVISRYEHPKTEEVRIVSVPMVPADDIPMGTLQSIADQCGAEDFRAWCEWINANR
jgi:predicted RNA binding protein YcfA (HicA-like mRNA interferase family)